MPGVAKSDKGGLSGKLKSHHKDPEEINVQGGNSVFQQSRVTVKYPDKGVREEKDQCPDRQGKDDAGIVYV